MSRPSKQNIGNTGEYFVASILSGKDCVTTITLGRAERYDLIAVKPTGSTIKISVKTLYESEPNRFPLSQKDEIGGSDDFFYVFVALNELKKPPTYWVVPSKDVNRVLSSDSKKYLRTIGVRSKRLPNDTGLRNIWFKRTLTAEKSVPKWWWKQIDGYRGAMDLHMG